MGIFRGDGTPGSATNPVDAEDLQDAIDAVEAEVAAAIAALLADDNVWTGNQDFSGTTPNLDLAETDTTDEDWRLYVANGQFNIVPIDEGGTALGPVPVRLEADAGDFYVGPTHMLYDNRTVQVNTGLATIDSSRDLALSDMGADLLHFSGSAHTWTIPPNSTTAFPIGTKWMITNNATAGVITLARGTGVALFGRGGASLADADKSVAAGNICFLMKYSTDSWVVLNTAGVT